MKNRTVEVSSKAKAKQKKPAAQAAPETGSERELTRHQRLLVDLCAEFVLHGGTTDALLDEFLAVLIRQEWKLAGGREVDQDSPFFRNRMAEYRHAVLRDSHSRKTVSVQHPPDGAPVVEWVRGHRRAAAAELLQGFLTAATEEEITVMLEVLRERDGLSLRNHRESALLEAMSSVLQAKRSVYIAVPEHQAAMVREFVETLTNAESAASARARVA